MTASSGLLSKNPTDMTPKFSSTYWKRSRETQQSVRNSNKRGEKPTQNPIL